MARQEVRDQNSNEDSILNELRSGWNKIRRYVIGGAFGIVAAIGAWQSFYTVPADSQAVVRNLGAYSRTTEPGLHFKLPFGIENADIVPVRKVQKEEFGFRTIKSGIESTFISGDSKDISPELRDKLKREYLMLTGDLNMADVEWIVQYQISDPVAFTFNVREPSETIRDISLASMKQIIGDGSVDEAITIGRIDNENSAKDNMQSLLDSYKIGIKVMAVKLQSANPPAAVRFSFNGVSQAMQERETAINMARKEYNSVIPEAQGRAEAMVKEAEAYAINRTNEALGDSERFLKFLEAYKRFPSITRTRLYLETMTKVLPKLDEKTIVEQKAAEGGFLLHYNAREGGAK